MASGDALLQFGPLNAEVPTSAFGTLGLRNQHPVLNFDTTTQETVFFTGVLPQHYGGGGITVFVHWAAATATTGTIGWLVAFERIGDGSQDIDADGFASDQTITAATVPGTSGNVDITSVAVTDGANIDSVAVGEAFRLRLRRNTATDTAAGDAQVVAVLLGET